jgi:hypothetical protein
MSEAYRGILCIFFVQHNELNCHIRDHMAEWSKALCLGRSLRAWVRTPLWSMYLKTPVSTPGCGESLLFLPLSGFIGCQNREKLLLYTYVVDWCWYLNSRS